MYQDATAEKARLSNQGLSADAPRIKALDTQIATYSKILTDQLNALRTAQANRLRLEKDKLSVIETAAADSRKDDIAEKDKMGEYIDAKNKYIRAQKALEAMKVASLSARIKDVAPAPAAKPQAKRRVRVQTLPRKRPRRPP